MLQLQKLSLNINAEVRAFTFEVMQICHANASVFLPRAASWLVSASNDMPHALHAKQIILNSNRPSTCCHAMQIALITNLIQALPPAPANASRALIWPLLAYVICTYIHAHTHITALVCVRAPALATACWPQMHFPHFHTSIHRRFSTFNHLWYA